MFRTELAKDLVLIVNSSYRRVNDPRCGHEQRKAMFRWYRYFNAIHYLAYLHLVQDQKLMNQSCHRELFQFSLGPIII